jgi:hypothetical protein
MSTYGEEDHNPSGERASSDTAGGENVDVTYDPVRPMPMQTTPTTGPSGCGSLKWFTSMWDTFPPAVLATAQRHTADSHHLSLIPSSPIFNSI